MENPVKRSARRSQSAERKPPKLRSIDHGKPFSASEKMLLDELSDTQVFVTSYTRGYSIEAMQKEMKQFDPNSATANSDFVRIRKMFQNVRSDMTISEACNSGNTSAYTYSFACGICSKPYKCESEWKKHMNSTTHRKYIRDPILKEKYKDKLRICLYDALNTITPECYVSNIYEVLNGSHRHCPIDTTGGSSETCTIITPSYFFKNQVKAPHSFYSYIVDPSFNDQLEE